MGMLQWVIEESVKGRTDKIKICANHILIQRKTKKNKQKEGEKEKNIRSWMRWAINDAILLEIEGKTKMLKI